MRIISAYGSHVANTSQIFHRFLGEAIRVVLFFFFFFPTERVSMKSSIRTLARNIARGAQTNSNENENCG